MESSRDAWKRLGATPPHLRPRYLEEEHPDGEVAEEVEDETVETAALDEPAVSEAEAVRRRFRDELTGLLARAAAEHNYAAKSGRLRGGIESLLVRLCGGGR